MSWLKALHLIFMVTWFAGLFYLPRLFVYHATTTDKTGHQRFCTMERRLFAIMTIGGALTIVFGVWLLGLYLAAGWAMPVWMHLKLVLITALIAYHLWCWALIERFAEGRNIHSERWFRWFNEIPAVILVAVILLAVLQPV